MTAQFTPWPKWREDALRYKWNVQGKTAGTIAQELVISRNAVIGKAHRLHLDARPSPIQKSEAPKSDWPVGGCKFIHGDNMKSPTFCGAKALPGQSWCANHHTIVFKHSVRSA